VAVPQLKNGDQPLRYSADGKSIFVERDQPNPTIAEIWKIGLANGQRDRLFTIKVPDLPGMVGLSFIAVSPDGKAYSFQYVSTKATLYVVKGVR
jgi:hypothetical protein